MYAVLHSKRLQRAAAIWSEEHAGSRRDTRCSLVTDTYLDAGSGSSLHLIDDHRVVRINCHTQARKVSGTVGHLLGNTARSFR